MFELHSIYKSFGGNPVIRGVDLAMQAGATAALVGPSGCGKSTLLRLMLGLVWPDSGEVTFDGRPLQRESLRSVRRRVGYVIQDGGLFPHLTAAENVTLMARQLRWSPDLIRSRLDEIVSLTRFPLEGLRHYPVELSGGQQQRVALMRALMIDPEVLLLDEPLGALDPLVRFELQADLRRIFRDLHKTTILVTHDLGEAAYLGDEIILMREGRIAQRGALREFVERPASDFVSQFFTAQRGHREVLEEAR